MYLLLVGAGHPQQGEDPYDFGAALLRGLRMPSTRNLYTLYAIGGGGAARCQGPRTLARSPASRISEPTSRTPGSFHATDDLHATIKTRPTAGWGHQCTSSGKIRDDCRTTEKLAIALRPASP